MTLRPWELDETPTYLDLRDDQVVRFTTEPAALGEEECRQNLLASRGDPNEARFAISDAGGRPVGNLTVIRRGDTLEISYWLAPHARGRGWASSALRAATEWAFRHWEATGAELEIDLANEASMWVAEAAGYRRRGTRLTSACGGPAALFRRSAAPSGSAPAAP